MTLNRLTPLTLRISVLAEKATTPDGIDPAETAEIKHLGQLVEAGLDGRTAAIDGAHLVANPYESGTEEYVLWRDCWLEADAELDKEYV